MSDKYDDFIDEIQAELDKRQKWPWWKKAAVWLWRNTYHLIFVRRAPLNWIVEQWQKLTRGFSDRQICNLNETAAGFTIPRLRYLRKWTQEIGCVPDSVMTELGHTGTKMERLHRANTETSRKKIAAIEKEAGEKWLQILDEMIFAFECYTRQESVDAQEEARANEGMKLFARFYGDLWV